EHVDFRTALVQLAEKAGVVLKNTYTSSKDTAEKKEKEEELRDVCEEATKFFEAELKKRSDVYAYIKERGVTDETISAWRIGYAPASWRDLSDYLTQKGHSKDLQAEAGLVARSQNKPGEVYDRFRGRIMFPLSDAGGKVIAFSGRFFEKVEGQKDDGGEPAKYVNSPETPIFKKSRVLYGFDKAKNFIRKTDCALLVEGQFDVILSHQAGLPFAVASSGTAITEEHLGIIGRLSKRLILALDGDSAGIRAGLKSALMALKLGFDVKIPTFQGAKDPADLVKENPELLKTAIRNSKTAIEFFLQALRPQARDERAYKKLVETQILPLVAVLPSKIEQAHFVRIVSQTLGVPEDAIYAEVAKRPALSDPLEDAELVREDVSGTSALVHAALLLLAHFNDDAQTKARIQELLGADKALQVRDRYIASSERYLFEFENMGDDAEASVAALWAVLERGSLEGEMARVKAELSSAPAETHGALIAKLADLKKREQELRK
ncbi:MAG TPA: DNA primase, partial [Candidatus Paceibacterota bacterium]|nr:DNA primase [Candidatus Paceibacterota bacterium]